MNAGLSPMPDRSQHQWNGTLYPPLSFFSSFPLSPYYFLLLHLLLLLLPLLLSCSSSDHFCVWPSPVRLAVWPVSWLCLWPSIAGCRTLAVTVSPTGCPTVTIAICLDLDRCHLDGCPAGHPYVRGCLPSSTVSLPVVRLIVRRRLCGRLAGPSRVFLADADDMYMMRAYPFDFLDSRNAIGPSSISPNWE